MNDSPDHELRSQFKKLCEAETADAPDFRNLLDRADRTAPGNGRVERRRLSRFALPIAFAAVVIVAAGVASVASVARRRTAVQVPLSSWISPTAGLLRTPGVGLLGPANILSSRLSPSLFINGIRR